MKAMHAPGVAIDTNPVSRRRYINDSEAFTWRAGAVYLFDDGLAPYASYAESFQPQVSDRRARAVHRLLCRRDHDVRGTAATLGLATRLAPRGRTA